MSEKKSLKSYTVLSPIKRGDEIVTEGSVELTESEAKRLIHLGVVAAPAAPSESEAPKKAAK